MSAVGDETAGSRVVALKLCLHLFFIDVWRRLEEFAVLVVFLDCGAADRGSRCQSRSELLDFTLPTAAPPEQYHKRYSNDHRSACDSDASDGSGAESGDLTANTDETRIDTVWELGLRHCEDSLVVVDSQVPKISSVKPLFTDIALPYASCKNVRPKNVSASSAARLRGK